MKTNVTVIRKMGDFNVTQRTKDGMFNATALLKQWNKASGMKKEVKDFFVNKQTTDFIKVLVEQENLNKGNSPYLKTRGKNGGTWMHPFLFIKFSMWLNPKFEYQVIKFVYDELIKYRNLSGDHYNELCSALSRQFSKIDYREVAMMLNYVIFNSHEKGIRNSANPEQQKDLQQLERDMAQYIKMGFVKSYEHFKKIMRGEWAKRHISTPKVLTA